MSVGVILPRLIHDSRGKAIERFFRTRCSLKERLMKEGTTESRADALSKSVVPEKVLTDSLFRIGGRNAMYGIPDRTVAKQLAAQIIGEPGPVELQRYRFLESQGAELHPYQSIADKLARLAVAA